VVSLGPAIIVRALLVAVAGFALALLISLIERERAGALDATPLTSPITVSDSLHDGAAAPSKPTQGAAAPLTDLVHTVAQVAPAPVEPVVNGLAPVVQPVVAPVAPVVSPVVAPVADALAPVVQPVVEAAAPVVAPVLAPAIDVVPPAALPPVARPARIAQPAAAPSLPTIAPGAASDSPAWAPAPSAGLLAAPGVHVAQDPATRASAFTDGVVAALGDLTIPVPRPAVPSLASLPSSVPAPSAPAGPAHAAGLAVLVAAAVLAAGRGQRFRCATAHWDSIHLASLIERPG
jgi:hypothetical protein